MGIKASRKRNKKIATMGLASIVGVSALVAVSPLSPFNVLAAPTPLSVQSPKMSVGTQTSLVILPDKTVMGWGANSGGQVGDGTKTDKYVPTAVLNLTDVVSVETSGGASFAITSSGKVYGWGSNYMNVLHPGVPTAIVEPMELPLLQGAKHISVVNTTAAMIKEDGTLWMWGNGMYGVLGNGSETTQTSPVQVTGLTDVVDVEIGSDKVIALKSDGTVWTWGMGGYASGRGASAPMTTVPVQLTNLSNIKEIQLGGDIGRAVTQTGEVYQWGGYAGTGSEYPTLKAGISGVVELDSSAPSYKNVFALAEDGTVHTWTDIQGGVTKVPIVSDIVDIEIGKHYLAMNSDGAIYSWGENVSGQLGRTGDATAPTLISGLIGALPNSGDTPPVEEKFNLWNPSTYGQLFVSTIVPTVTVSGGQPVTAIKLNGFDYNITEPIPTNLGDIELTPDGSGNTILSIPDGLGTTSSNEHLDVMYNGTNILDIEVKAKPVLNFKF